MLGNFNPIRINFAALFSSHGLDLLVVETERAGDKRIQIHTRTKERSRRRSLGLEGYYLNKPRRDLGSWSVENWCDSLSTLTGTDFNTRFFKLRYKRHPEDRAVCTASGRGLLLLVRSPSPPTPQPTITQPRRKAAELQLGLIRDAWSNPPSPATLKRTASYRHFRTILDRIVSTRTPAPPRRPSRSILRRFGFQPVSFRQRTVDTSTDNMVTGRATWPGLPVGRELPKDYEKAGESLNAPLITGYWGPFKTLLGLAEPAQRHFTASLQTTSASPFFG